MEILYSDLVNERCPDCGCNYFQANGFQPVEVTLRFKHGKTVYVDWETPTGLWVNEYPWECDVPENGATPTLTCLVCGAQWYQGELHVQEVGSSSVPVG